MPWAKLDDQYPDHPKIVEVGPLGMALHTAATCYCSRYLTDGFVPEAMIDRLVSFTGISRMCNGVSHSVTNADVANDLVEAGLFEIVPGGFKVHDYEVYNPPSDEIKAKKAANAARQADWREKKREKTGRFGRNAVSNAVTNDVTNASSNTAPSPSPIPSINKISGGGSARPQIFTVYEREIGALTGMVAEFLKGALEDYPEAWIEDALREAARQNKRSWSYADAILKRRKAEGTSVVDRQRRNNSPPVPMRNDAGSTPVRNAEIRRMAGLKDDEY